MTIRGCNSCLTRLAKVCGSETGHGIGRLEVTHSPIRGNAAIRKCMKLHKIGNVTMSRQISMGRMGAVVDSPGTVEEQAEKPQLTLQDLPTSDESEDMLKIRHSVRLM